MDEPYPFDRVIAPLAVERFLAEDYERRTLVLRRDDPDYYRDLVSPEALDQYLASLRPLHPQVFMVDARREILPAEYTLPDQRIDVIRLYQLFAGGATISFRQMQDRLPTLARLCRGAEQLFNCHFQANLYYSPAGAQGFKTHHDTHDVFVLQAFGSKQWQVYETEIELPLTGQDFEGPPGSVIEQFTLRAGDLFYCPRGVPHDAQATDEPSLHITFGVIARTWADVMIEAMAGACLNDAAFRANLPVGYATKGIAPEILESTFRELADRFSRSGSIAPVVERFAEEFVNERRALMADQRSQMMAVKTISPASRVGLRPGLIYRYQQSESTVALHCHGTEVTFPRHVEPALSYVLKTPSFVVRDMAGELDDAGKLVLVRRLIQEGLMTVVSPGAM